MGDFQIKNVKTICQGEITTVYPFHEQHNVERKALIAIAQHIGATGEAIDSLNEMDGFISGKIMQCHEYEKQIQAGQNPEIDFS